MNQEWFCEQCDIAGDVCFSCLDSDVYSVVLLIEDDHKRKSPYCTNPTNRLRVGKKPENRRTYQTEEILGHLRQGLIVIAPRQSGKTTALIQFASELLTAQKNVAIQTINGEQEHHVRYLWDKMWSKVPMLPERIQVTSNVERVGEGLGAECIVLVDEYSRVARPHACFAATDSLPNGMGFSDLDRCQKRLPHYPNSGDHSLSRVLLKQFVAGWHTP